MCKCREGSWVRVPTEGNGIKYPMSDHHPDCDEFKQEEFSRVELDGTYCIVPKGTEEDIIGDCDYKDDYIVTTVMLTRDQFESLPEFQGF